MHSYKSRTDNKTSFAQFISNQPFYSQHVCFGFFQPGTRRGFNSNLQVSGATWRHNVCPYGAVPYPDNQPHHEQVNKADQRGFWLPPSDQQLVANSEPIELPMG